MFNATISMHVVGAELGTADRYLLMFASHPNKGLIVGD